MNHVEQFRLFIQAWVKVGILTPEKHAIWDRLLSTLTPIEMQSLCSGSRISKSNVQDAGDRADCTYAQAENVFSQYDNWFWHLRNERVITIQGAPPV